jgi:tetratricopeptide (TPR) repeat protein
MPAGPLRIVAIAGSVWCALAHAAPQVTATPPAQPGAVAAPALVPPGALRPLPAGDPALMHRSLEQVAEAIAPLRGEAPPLDAPEPNASVREARRLVSAGQLEAAVQFLAEHLRRDNGDLQAWRELGRVLDAAGRRDLANEAWDRVLSMQPLDPEALASGGVDAASARQPLAAAERLLRLRQMVRVGEAPQPEPREAIGHAVALGLSLRELGYLRAATQCLNEAWQSSQAWTGPEAAALKRQSADLMRIAGECALASGDPAAAAKAFASALASAPVEDRVSLGRLAWALVQSQQEARASEVVARSFAQPDAPGRSGLPTALAALPDAARESIAAADPARLDLLALRARVPAGLVAFASDLRARGTDRVHFGPALGWLAERMGTAKAVEMACLRAQEAPWLAAEIAAGLRATAATPSSLRAQFASRNDDASRLVRAHFELLGGEAQLASEAVGTPEASSAFTAPMRVVQVLAAGALEDGAGLRRIAAEPVSDARVAAALADAFVALGDRQAANAWSEKAIELDGDGPEAWLARARADLMPPVEKERPDGPQSRLAEARLAAERAWEAAPSRSDVTRTLLQLLAPDSAQRNEIVELLRQSPQEDVSLRELDRAEALRRVQAGQGEPALDPLRTLLVEDPLDAEVARALVSAGAAAEQLDAVERLLLDLCKRRPATAVPLEALFSVLAKRGRIDAGVLLLRQAALDEPESLARRLAWARALAIAGRADEAWAAFDALPDVRNSPRLTLERAEFALRANREDAAMRALRGIQETPSLSSAQRLTALTLALRLSAELPGRRELAGSLGTAALASPDAGPLALAAAMLAGDDLEAAELARSHARAWSATAITEAAQRLIDEREADRAAAFLRSCASRITASERVPLLRASLAALAAADQPQSALELLRGERAASKRSVLVDASNADEATEINELAGMFLMAGRDASAVTLFQTAVELRPDLGEALNNLAWMRIVAGQLDATTGELVRRALEAGPQERSTLDTAGWWSYVSGAPLDQALERLRRATDGPDPGLEPLDHLGDALWASNLREEATTAWRLVVERGRGSASRAAAMQAFDRMQSRRTGLRAWSAASFYDARDGAAIARAQAKLQAIAEGREPPIAPRPPATPTPASVP